MKVYLMIVPGGQPLPAGGAGGGEPDALREAVRAEDVTTHRGQEVVTWGQEINTGQWF